MGPERKNFKVALIMGARRRRKRAGEFVPSPDFKYNFENVTVNFFSCNFWYFISLCPFLIKFLRALMDLT